jgi:hypothetical protein
MTKDGRPSLLFDIRHFVGIDRRASLYLKGCEDAVAFGRRMAWFLNGEGVSLGAYSALYLLFTPSIARGDIQVTDEGGDWWQRYTYVGVLPEFPQMDGASEVIMRGTIGALKAIRPDLGKTIDIAADIVAAQRENLRFLLKSRETKRFVIEISSTIAEWPQPSHFFVSLTDRVTGEYFEAPPISLSVYLDALALAGTVKLDTKRVQLVPNTSIFAKLTAARHEHQLSTPIDGFIQRARPVFSKRVRRRG